MWTFEQSTGRLYDNEGMHIATGYSGGNGGKNPEGVNNPDMQHSHNIGPIPVGLYDMEEPVEHTKLGPFAIPLNPHPANEMYGRSGFYCHGDNYFQNDSASDGCIIMPHDVREQVWHSGDHTLSVVSVYDRIS